MIGHIHFDRSGLPNNISEFLVDRDKISAVLRNRYVKIEGDGKTFIGRVVEGPFYIPEEVGRDSAVAQTTIIKGDQFPVTPNYYALGRIEIFGELVDNRLVATNTRPTPKSKVAELEQKEVSELIGVEGDLYMGKIVGYDQADIYLNSQNKKVLPRNIGIFGTVGSGKTNTAQVIIEEASKAEYAVIVVDVEGEYVGMDNPTKELIEKLKKYKRRPNGLSDFSVYYPCCGDVPLVDGKKRRGARKFDIKFSSVDLYVLFELVQATEPQQRGLSNLVDELEKKKKTAKKKSKAVQFIEGTSFEEHDYTIGEATKTLFSMINDRKIVKATGYALVGKIKQLERLGIFDRDVGEIDVNELLEPGKVSVIDVSSSSDYVKNVVIASILRKIFLRKLEAPDKTPKTLLLIEEAHTFISREARDKMTSTIDMLKIIARRGRKRWLCLGFISQQPSHLPQEIFELCNTRIVHSIKSRGNINAIKDTTGGVIEEIWSAVPALSVGQALAISPQFKHPVLIDVKPCETKREFID
ncbi:MAG: ATP-binding protein [Promethearchaeota archaeon]